jgi:hypothetical protein
MRARLAQSCWGFNNNRRGTVVREIQRGESRVSKDRETGGIDDYTKSLGYRDGRQSARSGGTISAFAQDKLAEGIALSSSFTSPSGDNLYIGIRITAAYRRI